MKRKYKVINWSTVLAVLFVIQSCSDDGVYHIPDAKTGLQNDLVKRSIGPNVVGGSIDFAYAMAILKKEGTIIESTVEPSIEGATGTILENKSYHTGNNGVDVGVEIGGISTTSKNVTKVTFTKDTSAATLRYHYVIPEAARGKGVSFKFSSKASNGQTVSYVAGPYVIGEMDMLLDLTAKDATTSFISITDLKVYSQAEALTNPSKIDLIYLFRANLASFGHALVAPSADEKYLPGINLPAGVNNNTRIIKAFGVRDQHLARLQYGVYVDDIDLSSKSFRGAPDFVTGLSAEYGVWVETADGKYKAFVFVNSVNPTSKEMRISIKRLKVK